MLKIVKVIWFYPILVV